MLLIRDFKDQSGVDKVIVLWTANTERFCDVKPGLNHTRLELEKSLKDNKSEISPSTIFAMASIAEKVISKIRETYSKHITISLRSKIYMNSLS